MGPAICDIKVDLNFQIDATVINFAKSCNGKTFTCDLFCFNVTRSARHDAVSAILTQNLHSTIAVSYVMADKACD
jgi:hypothetical protein